MIKKSSEIKKKLDTLRAVGNVKGEPTGFKNLDDVYSIKYGSYTNILAAPHTGKTEFGLELIVNQVHKLGKKALIYSPETGSVEDIYAELIHKHYGKSAIKSNKFALEDGKFENALNYVDHHYSVIDSDERSYTYYDIMNLCTDEDLIFVDPNNEVKHDLKPEHNGRQDIYIEDVSADIRRFCKKGNKHMIITMHPISQKPLFDYKVKRTYYPMPTAREAAGGQAWYRKAMGWINMWRPPTFIKDPFTKANYEDNIVLINIQKARPKGIGTLGTRPMYWDWKRNRYYEKFLDSRQYYAYEHLDINPLLAVIPEERTIEIDASQDEEGDLPF